MEQLKPIISKNYKSLTDEEIEDFFKDLDRNNDGYVNFEELDKKLHEVHEEIAPQLQKHHILHPRDAMLRRALATMEMGCMRFYANSCQSAARS